MRETTNCPLLSKEDDSVPSQHPEVVIGTVPDWGTGAVRASDVTYGFSSPDS